MNKIKPLLWPDDWSDGLPKSKWSRFWLGKFPPFGAEYKAEQFINKQLKQRNHDDSLSYWGTDNERITILNEFCIIIKNWFKWPNQNFIPDDPFQVIFFDATGFHVDDARNDAFNDMREKWKISATDINEWNQITLGEVVDKIKAKL